MITAIPKLRLAAIVLRFGHLGSGFLSWVRSVTQVPIEVRGSVIEAERQTERFATFVRLGIVILIGLVFAALGFVTGRFVPYIAVIYCINLALSLLGGSLCIHAFTGDGWLGY